MKGLVSRLRVSNLFWEGDTFAPELDARDLRAFEERLRRTSGQFSLALEGPGGSVVLARDKYGSNKLFFAIREDGTIEVANYISDLQDRGAPFGAILSVPSGHFTHIDPVRRTLETRRHHDLANRKPADPSLTAIAKEIRAALELWFGRMARQFKDREICICLSGGLDSSLIAALARRHFPHVAGFTYGFVAENHPESEDVGYAKRVGAHLRIPVDFIPATGDDIVGVLDDAIVGGQDWRDFNVHCAIVNELIGRHLAAHPSAFGRKRLVLTGDMMNEIMADYTPIRYGGRDYYSLPKVEMDQLRLILIRGLDAGDREIGVFHRHGLDAIQPYGLVVDEYLKVNGEHLKGDVVKQRLCREVGGDIIPPFVLDRKKVRAQIGTSAQPTGILPTLVESGRDSTWMKKAWCQRFGVASEADLNRFVRAGCYRFATSYPQARVERGYHIG